MLAENHSNPLEGYSSPSRESNSGAREESDSFTAVRRFLRDIWRHRVLFGGVALAIFVLGLCLTLVLPPRYIATSVLLVSDRNVALATAGEGSRQGPRDPAEIEDEVGVLSSRGLLMAAVRTLGLTPPERHGLLRGLLSYLRPDHRTPDERFESFIDTLKRQIKISTEGRSAIANVAVTQSDPKSAAALANAIVLEYQTLQQERRRQRGEELRTSLLSQAAGIERELAQAEAEVERYRRDNRLSEGRNLDTLRSTIGTVNDQVIAAKAAEESAYNRATALEARAQRDGPLVVLLLPEQPSGGKTIERAMALRFEIELARIQSPNPLKIAGLEAELKGLTEVLWHEARARLARLWSDAQDTAGRTKSLTKRLAETEQEAERVRSAEIQLDVLRRRIEVLKSAQQSVRTKAQMVEQAALSGTVSWVLSSASSPLQPAFPSFLTFAAASFFLALGGASTAVLLRERFGRR